MTPIHGAIRHLPTVFPEGSLAPKMAVPVSLAAGMSGTRSRMARVARPIAVTLWLAIVAMALAELWLIAATLAIPTPDQWAFRGFEVVLAISFGSVGALIVARRPENRTGWLALGLSVIAAFQGIVNQYPVLADTTSPPLPYADAARWVSAWIWVIPSAGLLTVLPLIFPNGRVLSPRWRPALGLSVVAMVLIVGSIIVASQPLGPVAPSANPASYFDEIGLRMAAGFLVYLAAAGAAATSVVLRYRRARNEERQQIKWVAFAGVLAAVCLPLGLSPIPFGQVLFAASGFFAAAAIGIAIFRFRLYEIDFIINRTLVYGALSAILAGVYTASITLSQRVFMAVTGERSDAAVVLTTLIVAATFTPVKTRLQAAVDRRIKAARSPAEVEVASSLEALEALEKLVRLKAAGALTEQEFETTKAQLLQRV